MGNLQTTILKRIYNVENPADQSIPSVDKMYGFNTGNLVGARVSQIPNEMITPDPRALNGSFFLGAFANNPSSDNAKNGDTYYNTSNSQLYIWINNDWISVGGNVLTGDVDGLLLTEAGDYLAF